MIHPRNSHTSSEPVLYWNLAARKGFAGKASWGKIMEALVLLRSVCDSDLNQRMKIVKRFVMESAAQ